MSKKNFIFLKKFRFKVKIYDNLTSKTEIVYTL